MFNISDYRLKVQISDKLIYYRGIITAEIFYFHLPVEKSSYTSPGEVLNGFDVYEILLDYYLY